VSDREGHFALLLDMLTATCTAEELQELGEELLRRPEGNPASRVARRRRTTRSSTKGSERPPGPGLSHAPAPTERRERMADREREWTGQRYADWWRTRKPVSRRCAARGAILVT
jgi:hypothetical protein